MTTPAPESASTLPTGRRAPAAWIGAILVSALMFSVGLMVLVAAGPDARPARERETLDMMLASVEAPPGWQVSIAESSLGGPTLIRRDVRVEFTSGVWEGSTESLVERLVELRVANSADATIPDVEESPERAERSVHRIPIDSSSSQGEIYVVRELSVVVVMTVRAEVDERADVQDDLNAMVDSLWLEELDLSIEQVEL